MLSAAMVRKITEVGLDRMGGAGWQGRRSRIKKRLKDMAEALLRIAAVRQLKKTEPLIVPEGAYQEFATGFPYDETEDQLRAIENVVEDLSSGRPMDRLVCGDVGFGKTEVALRAAFVAATSGKQVAVIVPTTLLARQHYRNFRAALRAVSAAHRPAVAFGDGRRRQGGQGSDGRRHDRYRDRHAFAAGQGHQL